MVQKRFKTGNTVLRLVLLHFRLSRLLLLRPQKRRRGTVMSTSVCLCVCLSARISPEQHARSLPIFSVHVACGRGSVLLRQVTGLYDVTYHAFEVRIDDMYHGRGGAVAVGVSAACEAERA